MSRREDVVRHFSMSLPPTKQCLSKHSSRFNYSVALWLAGSAEWPAAGNSRCSVSIDIFVGEACEIVAVHDDNCTSPTNPSPLAHTRSSPAPYSSRQWTTASAIHDTARPQLNRPTTVVYIPPLSLTGHASQSKSTITAP